MSKIAPDTLSEAIASLLEYSLKTKKRKFLETIELQISLKNFDPSKEKRISGSMKVPIAPRPNLNVCILGNAAHCDEAKAANIPCMSKEQLAKMKKDKKLVKKLAQSYSAFMASPDLVRQIPRLLGPGLNKAGKFPTVLSGELKEAVNGVRSLVKFQLKSKKSTCMGVAVANVGMEPEDIRINIVQAVNFVVSLLKKNWQNIKRLYIKSTMGPSYRIFGL